MRHQRKKKDHLEKGSTREREIRENSKSEGGWLGNVVGKKRWFEREISVRGRGYIQTEILQTDPVKKT